jgi:hypothetical protein
MILISHRGNLTGPNPERENTPEYIDEAIDAGFDVEIDVWCYDNDFFLGHDFPEHKVSFDFLLDRAPKLWIHCKNVKAMEELNMSELHCFWHQDDDVTLTNEGVIWAYPGKQPIKYSIAVMPEINNDDVSKCIGICSDYIQDYK